MEADQVTISEILEASEKMPLRCSYQHSGGESVQFDGLPAQQREAQLVRRECVQSMLLYLKDIIDI